MTVNLSLTDEQAAAVRTVLEQAVRDFSSEIAGTDNPSVRDDLKDRRDRVREVVDLLGAG